MDNIEVLTEEELWQRFLKEVKVMLNLSLPACLVCARNRMETIEEMFTHWLDAHGWEQLRLPSTEDTIIYTRTKEGG